MLFSANVAFPFSKHNSLLSAERRKMELRPSCFVLRGSNIVCHCSVESNLEAFGQKVEFQEPNANKTSTCPSSTGCCDKNPRSVGDYALWSGRNNCIDRLNFVKLVICTIFVYLKGIEAEWKASTRRAAHLLPCSELDFPLQRNNSNKTLIPPEDVYRRQWSRQVILKSFFIPIFTLNSI